MRIRLEDEMGPGFVRVFKAGPKSWTLNGLQGLAGMSSK